ncbi:MAG: hypothetical protein HY391_02460, partial [Deltaproteobacteria bacterium]|nr:hypothetical protein [Deltaproteobacteria bacterium]
MNKKRPVVVHLVGVGTIGEPLIGMFTRWREHFGIDEVTFQKRTPNPDDLPKIRELVNKRGAKLCVDSETKKEFEKAGFPVSYETEDALDRATVVVDCTPKGVGHKNKQQYYEAFRHNTAGFIAQGSEFGFGKMYAYNVNDKALIPGEDQFLQVVSCNTHTLAALVNTLGRDVNGDINQLEYGRFLLIRRANDISQDSDFIPSPQVGKHDDPEFGTHHARDVHHLFKTLGAELKLFSSALKVNTQYMHSLWFDIKLMNPVTLSQVVSRLIENPLIAVTRKRMANRVFSFGRDHGYYGRILSQAVISLPTLQVVNHHEVFGFAFTPQDGNSLLSSIAGTLWFIDPATYESKLDVVEQYCFK